jgi:drug/metabolite transporter (DMT)-like permease
MLGVAFIYCFTSVLMKVLLLHSSVLFIAFFYPFSNFLAQFPVLKIGTGRWVPDFRPNLGIYGGIGFLVALILIFQAVAVSLAEVSYVIAIKRTSLLFGIVMGAVFFGETHLREKLFGGGLMLLGVVFISLL